MQRKWYVLAALVLMVAVLLLAQHTPEDPIAAQRQRVLQRLWAQRVEPVPFVPYEQAYAQAQQFLQEEELEQRLQTLERDIRRERIDSWLE